MAAQTVKNNLKPQNLNMLIRRSKIAASIIECHSILPGKRTPASPDISVLVNSVARAVNNVSVSGNKSD